MGSLDLKKKMVRTRMRRLRLISVMRFLLSGCVQNPAKERQLITEARVINEEHLVLDDSTGLR